MKHELDHIVSMYDHGAHLEHEIHELAHSRMMSRLHTSVVEIPEEDYDEVDSIDYEDEPDESGVLDERNR